MSVQREGGGGEFFSLQNVFRWGDFGWFVGAPRPPPPGGCVGSGNDKLLPLTMTHDENVEMIHLGVQKLSSGNLDGGRKKKKKKF